MASLRVASGRGHLPTDETTTSADEEHASSTLADDEKTSTSADSHASTKNSDENRTLAVPPHHWRYLWDTRRSFDVPASPPTTPPALPDHLRLTSAAEERTAEDDVEHFMSDVHNLLDKHYVEDEDGEFRFALTLPYLRWALMRPSTDYRCLIGIREKSTNLLVGFCAAVPFDFWNASKDENIAWIDFVCVHNKCRGQRVCPFMYNEAEKRLSEHLGIRKIICTSGDLLPHPASSSRYYHRIIASSVPRLLECRFTDLAPRMTLARTMKYYKFPEPTVTLHPLEECDVRGGSLRERFNNYTRERHLAAKLFSSDDELLHTLHRKENIVYTYVRREDPLPRTNDGAKDVNVSADKEEAKTSNHVTDFISFYVNASDILTGTLAGEQLIGAYVFYSMVTTCTHAELLSSAAAALCNEVDVDHLCCLNGPMGFDKKTLKQCQFGPGTGVLNYYMYNFEHREVPQEKLAWYTT